MKIIILNICTKWLYQLYEEYILSIHTFIHKYYLNIESNILFYEISLFDKNIINELNLLIYDKIFYSGDLEILNIIIKSINNNFKKIYYINIEQMSHPSYYIFNKNINKNINIIDYSEENIPYYDKKINNIYLFPPFFELLYKVNNKSIDILSIINNEYRQNILNTIKLDSKYNILFIDNCFGSKRDDLYSKSKIYINIHSSNIHNTMELIRIINLLINNVIVITNNSIYSNLLYINKYLIICNDIQDLSLLVNEVLKNYNIYYNKIFNEFNYNEYMQYIKKNFNNIINDTPENLDL